MAKATTTAENWCAFRLAEFIGISRSEQSVAGQGGELIRVRAAAVMGGPLDLFR